MLDRLYTFFASVGSPEQAQVIVESYLCLLEMGIEDHVFFIEESINDFESGAPDITATVMDRILTPLHRATLKEFGIELIPDLPLRTLVEVTQAVYYIDNFEEKAIVYGLTEIEDPEDALAQILSVVTAKPSEDFLPLLEKVTPALLTRIADLTANAEQDLQPDPAVFERSKERTLKLHQYCLQQFPDIVQAHIDPTQIRLGFNLDVMLDRQRERIETLAPQAMAIVFLYWIFACDVETSAILNVLNAELELVCEDLTTSIQVSRTALKILQGLGYA